MEKDMEMCVCVLVEGVDLLHLLHQGATGEGDAANHYVNLLSVPPLVTHPLHSLHSSRPLIFSTLKATIPSSSVPMASYSVSSFMFFSVPPLNHFLHTSSSSFFLSCLLLF